MISLGGTDWLGLGGAISSRTHEACGVAPGLFASKDRKSTYDDCIDTYIKNVGTNVQNQSAIAIREKELQEKRLKQRQKIIIASISIVAISAVVIVALRQNKK